jgi:uncharacterized protein YdeI (YjbR/CyaY-like superfamily)
MKYLEIKETMLYITTRDAWRKWLEDNFETAPEVWLVFPKKASGKKSILYNDAVEEALCFGWIDSIRKTLDREHTIQRFSPRNPESTFSQPNKERLKWLAGHNMIHPAILSRVQLVLEEKFHFPTDIINEIRQDKEAWENYQHFSESYKRIRIAYIDSARKRPEEFRKRLSNFIGKTRENKLIPGYGGIEKYY